MIFVNCPNCGKRLLEGEIGSNVRIKCCNCEKVFNAKILPEEIVIKPKSKPTISESINKSQAD